MKINRDWKCFFFGVCVAIILLGGCTKPVETAKTADTVKLVIPDTLTRPPLPQITQRDPKVTGVLRALSLHSINSFFVYDGKPMGFEYEMLKHYTDHKKWALEIVAVHNYKELYDSISRGNFDAILGTIIPNVGWASRLAQTKPVYQADILVVATDSLKLKGSIHVIKNSPLAFWKEEHDSIRSLYPFTYADETYSKEQALALVAAGKLPNILVDKHEYEIMRSFFPQLNSVKVLEHKENIAFAFHPSLAFMRDDFDAWFTQWHTKKSEYGWIYKKYRALLEANRKKMLYEKPDLITGRISKYDNLVKNYSQLNELDWILVSALIYQESRFKPEVESPVGARGLMQLMPSVATTYKVDFRRLKEPRKNIEIGTKYFRWLYDYYDKDTLVSSENKIKFALASYNAGLGHIIDARALARKHKLDPNVWDDHVAVMLTNKHLGEFYRDPVVKYGHFRGWETYGYVQNIMIYYSYYQNHMEEYFSTEAQ